MFNIKSKLEKYAISIKIKKVGFKSFIFDNFDIFIA